MSDAAFGKNEYERWFSERPFVSISVVAQSRWGDKWLSVQASVRLRKEMAYPVLSEELAPYQQTKTSESIYVGELQYLTHSLGLRETQYSNSKSDNNVKREFRKHYVTYKFETSFVCCHSSRCLRLSDMKYSALLIEDLLQRHRTWQMKWSVGKV